MVNGYQLYCNGQFGGGLFAEAVDSQAMAEIITNFADIYLYNVVQWAGQKIVRCIPAPRFLREVFPRNVADDFGTDTVRW